MRFLVDESPELSDRHSSASACRIAFDCRTPFWRVC